MSLYDYVKRKQILDYEAKKILSNLPEKEIEKKAKKYKKKQIIGMSIFSFVFAIFFLFLHLCIPKDDFSNGLNIFFVLSSVLVVLFPISLLIFVLLKSNEKLAYNAIKQDLANGKGNIYSFDEMLKHINKIINPTDIIPILANKAEPTNLIINKDTQKIVIQQGLWLSKIYNFSEMINYEVYENGISKVRGTAGKTFVGKTFFCQNDLTANNESDKCTELKLAIRISDILNPQIIITYLSNVHYSKSGTKYKKIIKNLQEICSTLEYIINANTPEEQNKTTNVVTTKSCKIQIKELKEMLDEGLITQEEFEQKKKIILDL